MKIGIDARLWGETGVGRYVRNLVKNLQVIDEKNDYVLFVLGKDVSNVKQQVSGKNWKIVTANIHWHSLQEQVAFPSLLYKENLDLMHFPYFSLPIFYKGHFVVTIHDLIIYHYPTGRASTLPLPIFKIKYLGYKTIVNQAIKNANRIIVPLESVKKDLIETTHVNENKIAVTQEGVDEALFHSENKKTEIDHVLNGLLNSKYFLYVGNAYPHKNIETLLRAFNTFREKHGDNYYLYLIGNEDFFYKRLKQNFKNKHFSGVKFLHNIKDDLLRLLYRNALSVIAPSFIEGFGLVPLEAMANGCLVLASDIPAHREVCDNAAIYFRPSSPDELVQALKKVSLLKEEEKQIMQELAMKRVKIFSWKKTAQETIQVYESCFSI